MWLVCGDLIVFWAVFANCCKHPLKSKRKNLTRPPLKSSQFAHFVIIDLKLRHASNLVSPWYSLVLFCLDEHMGVLKASGHVSAKRATPRPS